VRICVVYYCARMCTRDYRPQICLHTHACMHAHTHIHTHTLTYTHRHTHNITHTQTLEARRLVRYVEGCLSETARTHELESLRHMVELLKTQAQAQASSGEDTHADRGAAQDAPKGSAESGGLEEGGEGGRSTCVASESTAAEAGGVASESLEKEEVPADASAHVNLPTVSEEGVVKEVGGKGEDGFAAMADGGEGGETIVEVGSTARQGEEPGGVEGHAATLVIDAAAAQGGGAAAGPAAVAAVQTVAQEGTDVGQQGMKLEREGSASGRGSTATEGGMVDGGTAGGKSGARSSRGIANSKLSQSAEGCLDQILCPAPSLTYHASLLRTLEARVVGLEGELLRVPQQQQQQLQQQQQQQQQQHVSSLQGGANTQQKQQQQQNESSLQGGASSQKQQPLGQQQQQQQQHQDLKELQLGIQDMRAQLPLLARAYEVDGLRRSILDTKDALAARTGAAMPSGGAAPLGQLNLTITLIKQERPQQQHSSPRNPAASSQQQGRSNINGGEEDGGGGAPTEGSSGSTPHAEGAPVEKSRSQAAAINPEEAVQCTGGGEAGSRPQGVAEQSEQGQQQAASGVSVLSVSGDEVELVLQMLQDLKSAQLAHTVQSLSRLSK